MRSAPTTSGYVIQESKGWGKIAVGVVALVFFGPMLLSAFAGALTDSAIPNAGKAADKLTCWPVQPACPPGNARRMDSQSSTAPTTAAAPQEMTQEELQARMQAKQLGDGLAAARIAPAAPAEDGGYWPRLGEAPSGGLLGELPVVGGAVQGALKALGPGGTKALNP